MEQMQVNHQNEAYCAWLKHCATIVKPCPKTVDQVIGYITSHYDTEPMRGEELESLGEFFAQYVEEHRYFNLTGQSTDPLMLVDRSSLSLNGFKIPITEKNKNQIGKYIAFAHKSIDEMYEDDPCGYVVWDESLQLFYAHGYGFLEIMDDVRIFQGVTWEDIHHLTYRFSQFVQLFPHSGYALSYENFINDMRMCRRYGFYNNQRLFEETLQNAGIQYECLGKYMADQFKKTWYESFVPPSLHSYEEQHCYFDKNGYCGYLWHVFSYGDLDCLKEEKAISAFDGQDKDECFVFFSNEEYAFKIKNGSELLAEILNTFDDVFIMDNGFRWTYIHPHESYCGPYFYKKGAAHEKEWICGIMKRPGLYVGRDRLDYIRHFLNGFSFVAYNPNLHQSGWAIDYDLEEWIFVNESASIRNACSINGWNLFFRVFGVRSLAVDGFRLFLKEDLLTEKGSFKGSVAWNIYECKSQIKNNDRKEHLQDVHYQDQEEPSFVSGDGAAFHQLIRMINGIIGEPVEEIKVYLYYDDYFMQIRFFFKKADQWIDGNTLKHREGYHERLIALHAQGELAFEEEYLNKTITIKYEKNTISVSDEVSSTEYGEKAILEPDLYKEEDCYFNLLVRWKHMVSITH